MHPRYNSSNENGTLSEKTPLTTSTVAVESEASSVSYGSTQNEDVVVDISSDSSSLLSFDSTFTQRWKDWASRVMFGKTANLQKSSEEERKVSKALRETANLEVSEIFKQYDTCISGISASEASKRLTQYGRNELSTAALKSWWYIIFEGMVHPFNILLLILGILAISVAEDPTTFYFVLVMVIVSVGLRSYEEIKSQKSFKSMRELIEPMTKVLRPDGLGNVIETSIPFTEVVPGDVIPLRPGDIFPGDCILVESKDLFISQSALTGEFLPVEKSVDTNESQSIFDLSNICFMSTSVVSGRGRAVVISTGNRTYISTINATLNSDSMDTRNSFDVGVKKVAYLLLGFGLVMVPIVIVINGLTTHDYYEAVLFGMSVLIGLTPEMLPMILNANLAYGAAEMAKHKTIVRKLDAIQTMGVVDVICSDKTGTLTKDDVVLTDYMDATGVDNNEVLRYAYINSTFSTGLKNVLDTAVVNAATDSADVDTELNVESEKGALWSLVEEFPFDFVRRRMSVIVKTNASRVELICKGAVEELLDICSYVREFNGAESVDVELDPDYNEKLLAKVADLNSDGLRVLAVACKVMPESELEGHDFNSEKDEADLVFLGFLTFLDPPKDDCAQAIEDFKKYHVGIKVLTGDNLAVACKVCKDVGIDTEYTISGAELEAIADNEEEFEAVVERCTVFAKLTPFQKFNIVNVLKKNGHTVGFLGDGINDALALRGADCGISVDTATPLAKDAADFILLEKSLNVITEAIIRGRKTHGNTIKYIKMAASSNFGNVFSVLVASAWLPFQPMTGNQILVQNLLYDISQIAIPWDNVDIEYLLYPHQWAADGIFRFMVYFGPLSSIFDIYTFLVLWFYFGYDNAYDYDNVKRFQTCWFYIGLITQCLIVHMIRTEKLPILQRNPSWQLAVATFIVVVIGIIIPFTPLGTSVLNMLPVPGIYYPFLIAGIVGYFIATQIVKKFYIHRYKEWL
ncbi:hypothetical protein V1511DRAFT_396373 [Dipodascopsis uninucleata]